MPSTRADRDSVIDLACMAISLSLLSWRAWLGLMLGRVFRFDLLKYGITLLWLGDIILVIGALGLTLGLVSAARVKE